MGWPGRSNGARRFVQKFGEDCYFGSCSRVEPLQESNKRLCFSKTKFRLLQQSLNTIHATLGMSPQVTQNLTAYFSFLQYQHTACTPETPNVSVYLTCFTTKIRSPRSVLFLISLLHCFPPSQLLTPNSAASFHYPIHCFSWTAFWIETNLVQQWKAFPANNLLSCLFLEQRQG